MVGGKIRYEVYGNSRQRSCNVELFRVLISISNDVSAVCVLLLALQYTVQDLGDRMIID